jgi:hypothetical protein
MKGATSDSLTRVRPRMPALLLLACLPFGAAGAVDEEDAVPAADSRVLEMARPRYEWGPHAVSRIYGLSYVEEDEPDGSDLRGLGLLWSSWDETVTMSGGLGWWLAWQEGEGQTIWDGGFEMTWLPWVPHGPVRFGPRLRIGLQHRSEEPDAGLSGIAAAGLELAVWLGDRFQVAVMADQEWPFEAGDRTQVGFSLRYARRRY